MEALPPSKFNLSRGVRGTVLWAGIGAVAPVVMMVVFTLCRWCVWEASASDRQYDIAHLPDSLLWPVIGCAAVCACTGWATYAPIGSFRFAKSLAIVFAASVPLWLVVGSMGLTPRRTKGIENPAIYPSELILVIGPPIVAAILLAAIRVKRERTGNS